MRLTCPSCASQYQVDAAAVGARGRMVRCANCGAEWFQSPGVDDDPVEEVAAAPAVSAPPPPPVTARPEPTIAAPTPEPEPAAPKVTTRAEIESYTPPQPEPVTREEIYFDAEPEPGGVPYADTEVLDETRVRRRAEDDRDQFTESLAELAEDQPVNTGGAFLAGFSTIAVLAVILIGLYIKAPDIAKVAPAAEEPLMSFIAFVDQGRMALAALTQ